MRKSFFTLVLLGVVLGNLCVWLVIFSKTQALTVSFLDVGQGDAILIESPTGNTLLIDGGRDRSVLRELGGQLSPLQRSIDVVIETHPDADHIGGLPGVFDRYAVHAFLSSGVEATTNQVEALEAAAQVEKDLLTYEVRRGDRIQIGGGAYLDVLFPDRDVSSVETNTGSVVARLVYGDTSFMLTGDSPEAIENYLVSIDGASLESDVLKAGHHGSRTSTGEAFLAAVAPGAVVISAGKDNSYGHPHEEVLARIRAAGIPVFSTLGEGAVVFQSDGKTVRAK